MVFIIFTTLQLSIFFLWVENCFFFLTQHHFFFGISMINFLLSVEKNFLVGTFIGFILQMQERTNSTISKLTRENLNANIKRLELDAEVGKTSLNLIAGETPSTCEVTVLGKFFVSNSKEASKII